MLKRSGFKKKSYDEALIAKQSKQASKGRILPTKRVKKPKSELMPARVKKAKKILEKMSHDFVRRRDSKVDDRLAGNCVDCGVWVEGGQFQAGHFEASGSCGVLLRYHPRNMHGQAGGCNMLRSQERVKIAYTLRMIDKYGIEYVNKLRSLKDKSVKADIYFYESLINMYQNGTEDEICEWIESFV